MLADLNVLADALEQDPEIKVVVFQSAHPEIFVAHAGIEWPREQGSRPRRSSRTSGDRPSGSRADLATSWRQTDPLGPTVMGARACRAFEGSLRVGLARVFYAE